ncbi:MAG TPA: aldehyde dehydrogenase (NADP(+)) [Nocardioidaceae bacterium]|nr:aldehyde dehydrogenase (NADP(+)) [Nocardioidaceae bacterium]
MITTTNPRTGATTTLDLADTSIAEVDTFAERALQAAPALVSLGREGRARALEAVADALEAAREELVRVADDETGLGDTRLNGELSRSAFQFRLFAEALREGSYLEAAIDHAADTPLGPGPDLRRMLLPIGPVAVFGASNFPFAFSVAGGDTASALAAGCPVVIKAHDSHPLTSLKSCEAIAAGLSSAGAPEGTVALVFGQEAAGHLIAHPAIKAVGFTGSLSTGKVLLDIVNRREDPIPFYGELSSLNPLVVTAGAAAARGDEIAKGLFTSYTGSGGQLCTKPGLAFVPTGAEGDAIVESLRSLTSEGGGHVLLNERISQAFGSISERLASSGAPVAARGQAEGDGFVVPPTLLSTQASDLSAELTEECFGPLIVVARYDGEKDLVAALELMPHSLTATVHAEVDEADTVASLAQLLEPLVGRLVFNGYPTGVRVSWAQHHGGPWPSTNSQHTSVGVTAVRRFLRPFVWQNAPESVLPEELHDGFSSIPRRIDGTLVVPGSPR